MTTEETTATGQAEAVETALVQQVVNEVFRPMKKAMYKPMTDEQVHVMLSLLMATPEKIAEMAADMAEKSIAFKIVSRRSTLYAIPVDDAVLMFLTLVAGTPAQIVMYLSFALWCAREHGEKRVSMEFFTDDVCPWGFCPNDDLNRLWDASKYDGSANGLDAKEVIDFLNSPKAEAAQ